MAGKIFVNYRRDDERAMAARVRDRLAATFGEATVFMDVDNLLAGQRFDKELEKALDQTDVFLAVIGPRWMELLGERRGERDYVREEIAGALQRGIVVIPVLIERTPLPRADALPEDIRDLVLHQKHVVTHERFGRDVVELAEAIRFARKAARAEAGGGGAAVRWTGAVALAALVLGGGVLAYQGLTPDRGAEAKRQEDRANAAAEKAKQEESKRVADAVAAKKPLRPPGELSPEELMKPGPLPDLAIGQADAPVTIVEYASMTCPACANFHNKVLPVLKEKYIDKGQVRLVFREFPFDERGALASMVARCAGGEKSLPLISVLFSKQEEWAQTKTDFLPKLFAFAQQAGFTRQTFDRCRQDEKLLKNLVALRDHAIHGFGVNQTPTFFINGKKLDGSTVEDFDKAIAPLLNR